MLLTTHFRLSEFIATDHKEIDNSLPQRLYLNAITTCNMLERVRTHLSNVAGKTVRINLTSGYRCLALNRLVRGAKNSDHLHALAADWNAPDFGTPYQICRELMNHMDELTIGQLIYEHNNWVHTGKTIPFKSANRILTISTDLQTSGIYMGSVSS